MKTCILSIASVVVCVAPSQAAPWQSFQMATTGPSNCAEQAGARADATAATIPAAERDTSLTPTLVGAPL